MDEEQLEKLIICMDVLNGNLEQIVKTNEENNRLLRELIRISAGSRTTISI